MAAGGCPPPPQAAATLPSQAAAMRPRCPRPAKEDGDGHLSPLRGPSLTLEQRVTGLPSSSVAPTIWPGMCRAPGGHRVGPTQPPWPLPRSSCSFLATFVAILREER